MGRSRARRGRPLRRARRAARPSARYPTLELRAPDCCTRLGDAIAIAPLYRVLVRHLYFDVGGTGHLDVLSRAIAQENKWRAQRYGVHGTFVTQAGAVSVGDFLDQVIAMTAHDALVLGCTGEVGHCRTIVAQGTSADGQIGIFQVRAAADDEEAALAQVTGWVAANTRRFD